MPSSSLSGSSSSISSFFDTDNDSKSSINGEDIKQEQENIDPLEELTQKTSTSDKHAVDEADKTNSTSQPSESYPVSNATNSQDLDTLSNTDSTSSSSETSSTSRNEDIDVDALKPHPVEVATSVQAPSSSPAVDASASEKREKRLSASVDKAIQFPSRPRTAKPGKYQTWRERVINRPSTTSSADTTEEEKRKRKSRNKNRPPIRPLIPSSTSSFSSITTFDDTSQSAAEPNASERLANYHNVKARELILHRYLDRHLAKQLDDQKSYFELRSPRGVSTKSGKRKPLNSSFRRKRGDANKKDRSPYGSSAAILTAYTPKARESDVKRNIRLLVAELAKYQSLNEKSSQIVKRHKPLSVNHKPLRPKSGRIMTFKEDSSGSSSSDSDASKSETSSGSSHKEDRYLHLKEKGSRHIKVVIPSDTGSEEVEKHRNDEEKKHSSRKSILKSRNSSRDVSLKHVLMTEQLEMEEAQKYRKQLEKRQRDSHPSILLGNLRDSDYLMADNHGVFHRVSLSPAPISPRTSFRRPQTAPHRLKRKQANTAKTKNSKHGRKQKCEKKEPINKEKSSTEKDVNLEGSDKENAETLPHTPRIQPGNGPIKCNWDPNKSNQGKKEPKFSDHQLKNSDNPAVLEWLERKNAAAQRNRAYRFREHRTKRNILMQEQNAKEDKKEHALIEYERWKKKKNREILLRRRKEALDATGEQPEQTTSHSLLLHNDKTKDPTITAFSDLRSHAIMPQPPAEPLKSGLSKRGGRPRPKSAPTKVSFGTPVATQAKKAENFIPVKIDFGNRDVTLMERQERSNAKDNLSAREPIMQNGDNTLNSSFMKDLLDVEPTPISMFEISPPGTSPKIKVEGGLAKSTNRGENTAKAKVLDRDHYNNWMKSNGTSSPYQIKLNRKKKKHDVSSQPLPKHDPMTNDLLSDLAKRRIQKIMNQKKRVDSGLKKNTSKPEAQNPAKGSKAKQGNSVRRWRLREDLNTDQPNQSASNPDESNDKISSRNGRPMFSFRKKKSKSIFEKDTMSTKVNTM